MGNSTNCCAEADIIRDGPPSEIKYIKNQAQMRNINSVGGYEAMYKNQKISPEKKKKSILQTLQPVLL